MQKKKQKTNMSEAEAEAARRDMETSVRCTSACLQNQCHPQDACRQYEFMGDAFDDCVQEHCTQSETNLVPCMNQCGSDAYKYWKDGQISRCIVQCHSLSSQHLDNANTILCEQEREWMERRGRHMDMQDCFKKNEEYFERWVTRCKETCNQFPHTPQV